MPLALELAATIVFTILNWINFNHDILIKFRCWSNFEDDRLIFIHHVIQDGQINEFCAISVVLKKVKFKGHRVKGTFKLHIEQFFGELCIRRAMRSESYAFGELCFRRDMFSESYAFGELCYYHGKYVQCKLSMGYGLGRGVSSSFLAL